MKHLMKRTLSLLCATVLLLTFVMTLVGCDKLLLDVLSSINDEATADDTPTIEEYEEAFYTVYEKQNLTSIKDEYRITSIVLFYLHAPEEYCCGDIVFTNNDNTEKVITFNNMPFDAASFQSFVSSFGSEKGVYLSTYRNKDSGELSHQEAKFVLQNLSKKETVKLYQVFLERCLQDYPDLLESQ